MVNKRSNVITQGVHRRRLTCVVGYNYLESCRSARIGSERFRDDATIHAAVIHCMVSNKVPSSKRTVLYPIDSIAFLACV